MTLRPTLAMTAFAAAFLSVATAAHAESLTTVEGGPYTVEVSKAEILKRAKRCASQMLSSGRLGGQPVLSVDEDVLVANSVVAQPVTIDTWDLKSRITLEAREGRFKITQSDIAWFISPYGWRPVYKQFGVNWKAVEANLTLHSARLAVCIQKAPTDNW